MNDNYTLFGDFDASDDYNTMTHMRPTDHGVFRAVVGRDEYPDAPEFDFGCPVFCLEYNTRTADAPEYGHESWKADGLDHSIPEVWERMEELAYGRRDADAIDLVDRYLRIFHGGGARLIRSTAYQGGPEYLVYDTRAMRASWGQTGETLETSDPEANEWQAYINSEVYVIWVEQADAFDEDGEPISWTEVGDGPVGGFYGDAHAAQAAIEELESTIKHLSAGMLPLEV